ncbi:FCS-Like Zinc finger 3-like [Oryza brachyantha]|uniref:FLZ-type domain-containing protein n=1 Tax=Oryza brachyantha TaxID=4533 RepID=J3LH47_ORYBR|nr:FCS-Like Zinc finger 3-like [Oryza brachyantha]
MSGKALGKRQRSQGTMHRTPSMASVPSAAKQGRHVMVMNGEPPAPPVSRPAGMGMGARGVAAAAQRRVTGHHAGVETAAFLKNCALCGLALGPGKDTYIYRGEVAFCSQECREWVIEYHERDRGEQNCSLTSIKDTPTVSGASGSDQSGSGSETVAAA